MVDLTAVVRLHWFPSIASVSRTQKSGLRDWIRSDKCLPVLGGDDFIRLEYFNATELASALGFDANYLALKALETIDSISMNETFPKATAWPSIKLYYSSYFAVMFLMRVCCKGAIYLESADAKRLKKTAAALGIAADLKAGTYSIRHEPESKAIKLQRMSDGLGVHESAWMAFQEFLGDLSSSLDDVLMSEDERSEAGKCLVFLSESLQKNNCVNGNWLSTVRNELNYRANDEAWFPYRNGTRLADLLKRLSQFASLDDLARFKNFEDKDVFYALGGALFGWFLSVANDLTNRSSGRTTLYKGGIENYLALSDLRHIRT